MKKTIILAGALSAVLLLMFYCAESKYDNPFDNPFDKKGTNYLYGDTTDEQEKIGDANRNGISDLFDPKDTVTFYANGGSGTPPPAQTVLQGLSITLPTGEGLSRTGYTFGGWNTTANGTGTAYSVDSAYTPDRSITLYARWTLNTFTITFDANGGTVTPDTDTTGEGWKLASLPTPTRSGYIFDGWWTEGGDNVTVDWVYNADATVYARWVESFEDSRDGTIYRKVKIGTQTWMAENLNYEATGSKCGNESAGQLTENSEDCNKYGRLYNWSTAMGGSSSSSASPSGVRGVCPVGWHIPSDAEWTTLTDYVGGASTAGTKLKSPQYWNSYSGVPEGTDEFGFAALPGGFGSSDGGFYSAGNYGSWWSATELNADNAWNRNMDDNYENVSRIYYWNTRLFSVRCVQD